MTREGEAFFKKSRNAALVIVLVPVALLVALWSLVLLTLYVFYRTTLYLLVWTLWLPKGKDILFVYSDSPIWREYLTTQILPRLRTRAVVMNWSERRTWRWWSLRTAVFQHFAGSRDFNPLIVLFRPFRSARIFRFWSAFSDWKHGDKEPVEGLCRELFSAL